MMLLLLSMRLIISVVAAAAVLFVVLLVNVLITPTVVVLSKKLLILCQIVCFIIKEVKYSFRKSIMERTIILDLQSWFIEKCNDRKWTIYLFVAALI